jgi:hypothetical protein
MGIGDPGGGLFRFREGHFAQYSVEQCLVSRVAFQIIVAHDGSLWIATPLLATAALPSAAGAQKGNPMQQQNVQRGRAY